MPDAVPNSTSNTRGDTAESRAGGAPGVDARSERRARFEQASSEGRVAVAQALNAARQSKGLSYRALEGASGVRIATLQGWLTGKYVPQMGMRNEFERLAETLDVVDPPGTPGGVGVEDWWGAVRGTRRATARPEDDEPPYPGMRPFDLTTARDFPGRTAQVDELRERIRRRLKGDERPLLLVTGRSGSGKSSLVAAAVSRLAEEARIEILGPSHAAAQALDALIAGAPDTPAMLVLDQAESLWSTTDDEVGERILDMLDAVQSRLSRVAVVIVMRADAVAPATDVPVLREILEQAHFVLGSITRADVRDILLSPTSRRGITLDPELIDVILKDAGVEPASSDRAASEALIGTLPLLSQTMRTLWEQRAAPDRITLADYHRAGGLATSIETAAEATYAKLSPEAQEACWPVLREMIRLDTPVPGRRTIAMDRFDSPASREVISTLRDAHLLMSDADGVTISHDLLMTTWPRLAAWLESTREWDAARRMLARYSALWDDSGRPDDLLTAGSALGLLETEELGAADALSRTERDFLEASRDAQTARLRASEAENARLRTSTRRFRTVALVASAFAVVAVTLGVVASSTAIHLSEARANALGGDLASRAQVVAATMPGEAAQLAIAAHAVHDSAATRSTLLSLTAAPQPRRLLSPAGPGTLAAADDLLVEGGSEHTIRLLDPATGEVRDNIETPASHTYALDLAETDDRMLLAASGEDDSGRPAQACVWDITDAPATLGCLTVPSKSDSAALLSDGTGALFGGADGTVQRLAVTETGTTTLTAIPGPAAAPDAEPAAVVGLASAGDVVVAVTSDGTLAALSDPLGEATWSQPFPLPNALSVTLSDDGSRFAVTTSQNFTVELGRIEDGTPVREASAYGFESWVNDAVLLPDGGVAAVGSDQTLRFFAADGILTRTQVLPSLSTSVVLAGTTLATYTVNGTTTLWPEGSFPEPNERGRIFEVTSDRGGEIVASVGSGDGLLRVERIGSDGIRTSLRVPETEVETRYGVATSPDGRFIASAGYGRLQVWRVEGDSLSEPTVVDTLPDALITEVRFSPDGGRIAVGDQSADRVVIYDVEELDAGPGAAADLTVHTEIPVLTGGAMRFAGEDVLIVHDGSWQLQIWDLTTNENVGTVDLDGQYPISVVDRPGHPGQFAFATESLEAGILDITDPAQPRVLSRVAGLTDTPRNIAFSSDGSRLAIAAVSHVDVRDVSDDGERISGSQLRLDGPMRTEITDAKFLLGDSRMVAATYSGLLWWWDLDPDRTAASICESIGDALTLDEGQALAPSLPDDAQLCGA